LTSEIAVSAAFRQRPSFGMKESPGRAGALEALDPYEELSSLLDAPILSQSTNQARREARKRPDPPRGSAR